MRRWVFLLPMLFCGCVYFHHVGKQGVSWQAIEDKGLLKKGISQQDVVQMYGEPDMVRKSGQGEVWTYHLRRSFHIILFGQSEYKDLRIIFDGQGKLLEYRFISKGSSTGVFIPPGM